MESQARAKLAATATADLSSAGEARSAATAIAARTGLDVLEVVDADGAVVSSFHWPAGFGLRDQDRTVPGATRFRMEKTAEGYGAVERLAVVAESPARFGGDAVVLRGGSFVDAALLDEVSRLTGAARRSPGGRCRPRAFRRARPSSPASPSGGARSRWRPGSRWWWRCPRPRSPAPSAESAAPR
jgi:hypothetical protein